MKRYNETLPNLCESGLITPGSRVISLRIPNKTNIVYADIDASGRIILSEQTWTTPS